MDKYEDNIDVELHKKLAKREKELKPENVIDEVNMKAKTAAQKEILFNELDNAIERRFFKGKRK